MLDINDILGLRREVGVCGEFAIYEDNQKILEKMKNLAKALESDYDIMERLERAGKV